jgi:hypothetical protein
MVLYSLRPDPQTPRQDHFQRTGSSQGRVEGQVDNAQAAPTQFLVNGVTRRSAGIDRERRAILRRERDGRLQDRMGQGGLVGGITIRSSGTARGRSDWREGGCGSEG